MRPQAVYTNILPVMVQAMDEIIPEWMSEHEVDEFRQQMLRQVGTKVFATQPPDLHFELHGGDSLGGDQYESGHMYVHADDWFNFMLVMVHATYTSARPLLEGAAA